MINRWCSFLALPFPAPCSAGAGRWKDEHGMPCHLLTTCSSWQCHYLGNRWSDRWEKVRWPVRQGVHNLQHQDLGAPYHPVHPSDPLRVSYGPCTAWEEETGAWTLSSCNVETHTMERLTRYRNSMTGNRRMVCSSVNSSSFFFSWPVLPAHSMRMRRPGRRRANAQSIHWMGAFNN